MGSDGGWDKSMRTEALIDDVMECELDQIGVQTWCEKLSKYFTLVLKISKKIMGKFKQKLSYHFCESFLEKWRPG